MTSVGSERIRILHCITSMLADGAQQMLLKLCEHVSHEQFEFRIVSLREPMPFSKNFTSLGIPVAHIGMRPALPSWRGMRQIAGVIDEFKPHLIQGWMYHGNLAALAGRRIAKHRISGRRAPVLWNIRKAVEDIKEYRPLTRVTLRIGAQLSQHAERVIYCGQYIASQHTALGYSTANQVVIPNGFDTARFRPRPGAAHALRVNAGIPAEASIVGMAARYHPHKDHENFLRCAAKVAAAAPHTHFVLAGRDVDAGNECLTGLAQELGIGDRVHLLGEQSAIEEVLSGLDVYCLSSSAEGFPNSLGEAMASGIPCVTTNAGASEEVLGDAGPVVPVRDPHALADAVFTLLSATPEARRAIGEHCRHRIESRYSLPMVAGTYQRLYLDTVTAPCGAAGFTTDVGSRRESLG